MLDMMNHQEWNSNSSSLVDVSSFLLFESSGDSEFDSNICSTNDSLITLNPSHQRFLEDDDAQSCSYDEDMEFDFKIENDDNDIDDDDDDDDDDDGDVDTYSRYSSDFNRNNVRWNSDMKDEDEDEGGVVEQPWMNNDVNRCNEKLKSNVCSSVVVDSELKSQKDKDKLFWEACLAS